MGKQTTRILKRLAEIAPTIYYSPFSILESLWVAARSVGSSTFESDRFSQGLRSVTEGGRYLRLDGNGEVYTEALRLYGLGHSDMIDNILYASSVHFGLRFLTIDTRLMEFVEEKGLERNFILFGDLS